MYLYDADRKPRYVRDILNNTSRSTDQVTVQPSGRWEHYTRPEPISKSNGITSSDDDDDLVEITKTGDSIQMNTPRTNQVPVVAPAGLGPSMREVSVSSTSHSQGSTSTKRPAAVIDLTSSGDEDEEPLIRQPKRQLTNNVNGLSSITTPAYRPAAPTFTGFPPGT